MVLGEHEHLGLAGQPAEGAGVQDPVPVSLEAGALRVGGFLGRPGRRRRGTGSHPAASSSSSALLPVLGGPGHDDGRCGRWPAGVGLPDLVGSAQVATLVAGHGPRPAVPPGLASRGRVGLCVGVGFCVSVGLGRGVGSTGSHVPHPRKARHRGHAAREPRAGVGRAAPILCACRTSSTSVASTCAGATAARAACRSVARRTPRWAAPTVATAVTGGDVWLVADRNTASLLAFRDHPHRKADLRHPRFGQEATRPSEARTWR